MSGPTPVGSSAAGSTVTGLSAAHGEALVRLAADAVQSRLTGVPADGRLPAHATLRRLGCSFVTLECAGVLRGCIGSLEPVRPLYRDVAANAVKAMADPRLDPVSAHEWPRLTVSVSVLSLPEAVPAREIAELRELLRPHIDGLIVSADGRRATFLPAVWKKLPDPADFLAALLVKGGWDGHRLPAGAQVRRYTATEFHHGTPHPPL